MEQIKETIVEFIKKAIEEAQQEKILPYFDIPEIQLEHPRKENFGDYASSVALHLDKPTGKTPQKVGNILVEKILGFKDAKKYFAKIEVAAPGFINFYLEPEWLASQIQIILKEKDEFGGSKMGKGKTIVIDYSAPNIAKPLSVAHLRSTIIGQALCNIYKFLGFRVIRDNHLGDWGTQFGKLIYAYKKWGNKKKIEKNPVDELVKLYVKFHQEAKRNPELDELARQETKELQNKEKENYKLWKWFREKSLKDFNKIYKILNVKFDYVLGESFYHPMLSDIIKDALEKKIARRSEGAIIIPLDEYNLPPLLIQKSDEAYLYTTTDIATIAYRVKKFKPRKILYVVANQQALYFEQLFQIAKILGLVNKEELVHVKFGMVLGKDKKKLATREGRAVSLKSALQEAIKRARKVIEEKNPKLKVKEKEKIARVVGVGALKYNDLSQTRLVDITFDWDKMLSLEGDSAPYLQYIYTRIQGIKRKVKSQKSKVKSQDFKLLNTKEEINLLRKLYIFPEVVERCAEDFMPHHIANFLFSLAQDFNIFYDRIPVLKAEVKLRRARLMLIEVVAQVIKNGLNLLGIEVLCRM